jgi:4-hydroxybenzoate polyprenyltransferase
MHAYSAVPDIDADKAAGLKTIAILIGKGPTILLCWFLYVLSAALVFQYIPIVASIGAIVFSYFMHRSYKAQTDEELFKLYTYFPLINSSIGMLVSLTLMYALANL